MAIPIAVAAIWTGGAGFAVLATAVGIGALLEFYWVAEAGGAEPLAPTGIVVGLAILVSFAFGHHHLNGFADASSSGSHDRLSTPVTILPLLALLLGTIVTFTAGMYRAGNHPLRDNVATVVGYVYVATGIGALLGLRATHFTVAVESGASSDHIAQAGALVVIALMVAIWTCDSLAYFAGRAFGHRPMFKRISPGKTWEGGIAGALGAVGAVFLAREFLLPQLSIVDATVLGLFAGIAGQIGDLAESHLKRDAGIKDSSQILPGHGGLLDRFDSLLFVAPLWYVYLVLRSAAGDL